MTNREIETLSIIHYILEKISKTKDEIVDYDDFMWILERSDILHILRYHFNIIDYDVLSIFADDNPSLKVVESFVDKKPIDYLIYSEFMSESRYECVNDAIKKYRLYGKWFLKLEWLWYKFWFKVTGVM
jgi:hypothetical protein